jgi:hypothetical protein
MGYPIEVNIDIKGTPVTDSIRLDACDAITGAVEASVTLPGPVTFPASATIVVPESKVYNLKVIQEASGGDILLNDYTEDSSKISLSTLPDLEFVVDRSVDDPVSGTSVFNCPALAGKTNYRLVQRGVGPLEPGVEWNYTALGLELLGGATFSITAGVPDTYFAEFYPDSTVSPQDLFLRVGRGRSYDPITGAAQYRNSSLIGQSYRAEQRSVGPRRSDEITLVADGFDLLGGELFNFDDTWVIHFYPTIILQAPTISGIGKEYEDIISITVDTVYDPAHQGKLIVARAAGTTIKYSLPLGAALPVGKCLAFKNSGVNAKFLTIETASGQDIEFNYQNTDNLNDEIWIGANEVIKLQWKVDRWVVINNWNMDKVMTYVDGNKVATNTLHLNGSLPLRAEQPRIWWALSTYFPEMIVSDSLWEEGVFSDGNGVDTFRLPDWTGMTAKAINTGARALGSFEADQVGEFMGSSIPAKAGSHGGASDAEAGTVALLNNSGTAEVSFTIKGSAVQHNTGKENTVKNLGIIKLVIC